jgi:hypothetical protein
VICKDWAIISEGSPIGNPGRHPRVINYSAVFAVQFQNPGVLISFDEIFCNSLEYLSYRESVVDKKAISDPEARYAFDRYPL